jgi:hypothetical protein
MTLDQPCEQRLRRVAGIPARRVRDGGPVRLATRHAEAIHPQREPVTSSTLSAGAFTLRCGPCAYGRHVSGAMENRAAVFTSKPQAVEVYQAGAWWSGELLGWRHADDGSCQVWVRVALGGVEETAWTDLDTLRLPERHLAMAPEPASVEAVEREQSVARHPSSRHRADSDASVTASLPMVRDLSVVPDGAAAPSGGRRRAPEVPAAVSTGGRRRAPEEPSVVSPGGRRRAPDTAETPAAISTGGRRRAPETAETPAVVPSGGRRRAPEAAAAAASSGPAALLGRHGGPASAGGSADPGRHRTADTGLSPAVSDATSVLKVARRSATPPAPSGRGRPVPSVRPSSPEEAPGGVSGGSWSTPNGLEAELLTRPMRLSDHVPHARRPRVDGTRRGV